MSNLISQLGGTNDVMRPVSVRVAPRVAAASPTASVTELSPSSNMPPVEFTAGETDSLATAFPSLAVITRRILNGMQEAMDRAIEDAAREAIEAQRQQAQSNAAQQAERDAKLEEALVALSKSEGPPGDSKAPGADATQDGKPVPASVNKGRPAFETEVVGGANEPAKPKDDVTFSRPAGSVEPADIGPSFGKKPALSRSDAGQILSEVAKTVRAGPRSNVERVHQSENLAYSAMLLNG